MQLAHMLSAPLTLHALQGTYKEHCSSAISSIATCKAFMPFKVPTYRDVHSPGAQHLTFHAYYGKLEHVAIQLAADGDDQL